MNAMNEQALPAVYSQEELCTVKRAMEITGQSRSGMYRRMKDPVLPFPKPIQDGRRTYFVKSQLHAWVDAFIKAKTNSEPM